VNDIPRFAPITRRTIAQEIHDRLADSITGGDFRPGSQLPSERALCQEFAVARTSVREAIQGLVAEGLVERRGNRTHVVERLPGIDISGEDIRKETVRQLFEVRRVIEISVFELAACRATDTQRSEITELAGLFEPPMAIAEFRALDRRFHWAIAQACGNALLSELYGKVLDSLFGSEAFESLLYAEHNQAEVDLIVAGASEDHRRIARAMAEGDPVAVSEAVVGHLSDVEGRMLGHLE